MQAIVQLAEEAQIYLKVDKFEVINSVGAVTLGATVNCEAFAQAHTDTVHYDPSSFVGLTWRPRNAPICVEVYSTGRANIPGAKSHAALLRGFARLVPELLQYSSSGRPDPPRDAANSVTGRDTPPDANDQENVAIGVSVQSDDPWEGWALG